MERYLISIDPKKMNIKDVATELKKMRDTHIDDILESVNIIIITAGKNQIPQIKMSIPAINSVEEEGEVSTL